MRRQGPVTFSRGATRAGHLATGTTKRRLVAGALAIVCLTAVVATLAYRHTYGTWWGQPQRIPYCGRTYLAGPSGLTLAEIRRAESRTAVRGDQPYPVVPIGRTPPVVGQAMLAALTPVARQRQLGVSCTMSVYLQTGQDSYTAYGISGGP